tara:strand:- start:58 stop:1059 length:1002 start_codon:yes stop_codon:yes gene_type:complete
MILKSFEVENNIQNLLKFKFILIYGENIGLKETLKEKIIFSNNKVEKINLYQEDLAKNKDIIQNEVKNVSLFSQEKLIFINQVNDKTLSGIEDLLESKENVRIVLIGDLLDKKSKLRNLFEKKNHMAVIPCYNDNDITLKKLIQIDLKEFKNLNSNTINMILAYSNMNRKNILNNLEKIKTFYDKKVLSDDSLETLLNSDRNEIFENIRDAALSGDQKKLNDLLGSFSFANEDAFLYLNMINFRLIRLLDIHKQNALNNDFVVTINKIKPPIFWKDKPVYLKLLKKWDKQSILEAVRYIGKTEEKIKKNNTLNNLTMIKNSITNICTNSWTFF